MDKKKEICLFTFTNPVCGGTDRMAVELANLLADNYNVTILGIYGTFHSFFKLNPKVRLKILFPLASRIKIFKVFSMKRKQKIKRLKKILKKDKTDVLIDVDTALTEISTPATESATVAHISWDHYSETLLKKDGIRQKAFEINAKHNNKVVALSKSYLNFYEKSGIYNSKNLHQIYNPSPITWDSEIKHPQSKTVLAVGRYHEQKGFDILLKAWKIVEKENTDWRLCIYGRKQEQFEEIAKMKDELKLHNVFLNGETEQIKKQYENAEIYVMSSRWEGHPLALIEACAASLPLVSFDCESGPAEIIENNKNGYLIEAENIEKLAAAILDLINNEDKRLSFGKKSYEISKKFSKENFVNSWINLIDSANL